MDQSTNIQIESAKGASQGSITIRAVPHAEARRKGTMIWAGCWGAALVMLPIPLVHFIAVPLLLLLGPLVGIVVYKITSGAQDIVSGGGKCPDCGSPVDLAGRDAHWPLDAMCASCQARLLIRNEFAAAHL
ncbi:MAG: hypothetical protein FJ146_09030 [Deltaproteobacteria bacterium]|nr:hypothetical protein [Deltaproteobacteria bacterium]